MEHAITSLVAPGTQHKTVAKRKIQLDSLDLDGSKQSKRRKLDFIREAHEALSSDIISELNICEC